MELENCGMHLAQKIRIVFYKSEFRTLNITFQKIDHRFVTHDLIKIGEANFGSPSDGWIRHRAFYVDRAFPDESGAISLSGETADQGLLRRLDLGGFNTVSEFSKVLRTTLNHRNIELTPIDQVKQAKRKVANVSAEIEYGEKLRICRSIACSPSRFLDREIVFAIHKNVVISPPLPHALDFDG